ncbi:MAG: hypothetical protein A4E64_02573 [Syntrophorhabdus sp. PtaU1.Bin058]|nr:MAG: hypothetical protein A4E64_02573 [Syntrophorhabdus sp. PtaU1.Bin058]
MDRTCRTGKVEYPVNLDQHRLGHIVSEEFKAGILHKTGDVFFHAGEVIIEADDLMPVPEELFAEMGPDETGAAGHEYPLR